MSAIETNEDETRDPEACPGCGCRPGEGVTAGCEHGYGCGYHRHLAAIYAGLERADARSAGAPVAIDGGAA